jgi:hypothetical protein
VPLAEVATLTPALVDIRARRWPDGERPRQDQTLIVMLDPTMPIQKLADVAAAVLYDPAGKPLFPYLQLAVGFQ